MAQKANSSPGTRKSSRQCGTASLEFCPTDTTPITLQDIVDAIVANGAAFEDGTAVAGSVIGTDLNIDAINIVAHDTGVRSNDTLTSSIVEGDECGVLITNNGSTIFAEANEVKSTESVYTDFAIAADAGTSCFQVDVTFESA
ncbi:MAG: hypothetical protein AAF236_02285 [Verrucomicrobiota bacterium]